MNHDGMTRAELVAALEALLSTDGAQAQIRRDEEERESLVHELQVHQVELELQNRELREAQSALESSRNRFQDLYDFAPVAYFTFDLRGCVVEANLTGATLVGRDRQHLLGLPFPSLVRLDEPPKFWAQLKRCADEGGPAVTELRLTMADGEVRDVQSICVPVLDAAGVARGFRTSFTDITERVRAESELAVLRRQEEQLRLGFQGLDRASIALNDALACTDGAPLDDLLRVIVDEAATLADAEFAALAVVDSEGTISRWVQRGDDPAMAARDPQASSDRRIVRATRAASMMEMHELREQPAFRAYAEEHPGITCCMGVPIHFGGRSLGHLYLANKRASDEFSDIDQQFIEMLAVRAGRVLEIRDLNEQIRAAVRAREGLLAAVSHDLRGPLTAIRLTAQTLSRPPEGGERRASKRSLDRVLRAVENMDRLIMDLLQAATIESGTFQVKPTAEPALRIVTDAVEATELQAAERAVKLATEVPPALPPIAGDRQRLGQVMTNLLDNALKFAPERSVVRVAAQEEGQFVHFTVADQGYGMTAEQLDHVFDRYWNGGSGTGLGLFIVKGIVEAHRGRAWAESHLGQGSAFHFTIPVAGGSL